MSKGQRGNKEAKKPKKVHAAPPPLTTGAPPPVASTPSPPRFKK